MRYFWRLLTPDEAEKCHTSFSQPRKQKGVENPNLVFGPNLVFLRFFVSELGAHTDKTDRQTDGRTDETRNVAY